MVSKKLQHWLVIGDKEYWMPNGSYEITLARIARCQIGPQQPWDPEGLPSTRSESRPILPTIRRVTCPECREMLKAYLVLLDVQKAAAVKDFVRRRG